MMLSNITTPLLGLVDTAVLGHLEHPGYLAAVAIGSNIFTFIFWAFGFLRMGTTGLVAQAYGKQDHALINRTLIQAIGLGLLIGLVIIGNQFWLIPTAITLMDGSENTQILATTYCQIRIWGAPATLIQYALIGAYIGLHKPKASLVILIFINSLNIIFDLLFVVVFDFNVVGVAFATILAEYCGVAASLIYLAKTLKVHTNSIDVISLQKLLKQSELLRFFSVNSDIFIRTCCLLFVFAFFTAQGAKQGDVILAANAVLLTFLLLISSTLDGFANAVEATVGQITGKSERNQPLLKEFVNAAIQWSTVTAALLILVFYSAGSQIISLLTDIKSVEETAEHFLPWLIIMPGLACLSYIYDGVFVGAVETKAMRNIMLICLLLVFMPLWLITKHLGNHGLWFSLSAFMLSRSILMHLAYGRLKRKYLLDG